MSDTHDVGYYDAEYQDSLLTALSAPFTGRVKQFKGAGGRTFDYVEGQDIIDHLNAVAKGWSFHNVKIIEGRYIDKEGQAFPETKVIGELTIPGLGTRSGMGVQVMKPGSGEDLEKGAMTDAIKTAARLFGVAGDLYRNVDERRKEWSGGGSGDERMASGPQVNFIRDLVSQGKIDPNRLREQYKVKTANELTMAQARAVLDEAMGNNDNNNGSQAPSDPPPGPPDADSINEYDMAPAPYEPDDSYGF